MATEKRGRTSLRDARHRAECVDFYREPEATERVAWRGPDDVIAVIELAAERTGRTWNEQLNYVLRVCAGDQVPSLDDDRTTRDWQDLMAQMEFSTEDDERWYPCAALFGDSHTPGAVS
ncbi:hypothetical protein YTPLAS18_17100 [Nitrospira sp.]|nr:hypothetical protein YTPLAS18_17100 [Nitrospira sp.]